MRLSVVVPCLNEAGGIAATLGDLAPLRAAGHEVIVVDGGSEDATRELAAPFADRVLCVPRGRAAQMNAGARAASGDVLWFVHADTRIPNAAAAAVARAVAAGAVWGRFDVRLSGSAPLLRVVETLMNLRSRWTGIATGDQGIFVARTTFEAVEGYPPIPLMEDVALSKTLRHLARPACQSVRLVTSSRRWERHGILRTVWLMWRLRMAFAMGADPARLAHRYETAES